MEEQMAVLRRQYVEVFPGKIHDIEECWNRMNDGDAAATDQVDWALEDMSSLRLMVHSLAGSGATFGFTEISEKARAAENSLIPLIEEDVAPSPEIRSEIEAHLSALAGVSLDPDKETAVSGSSPVEAPGVRLLYLVTEDSGDRENIIEQSRHFGYDVEVFSSLAEAYESALENHPAAVVVDLTAVVGKDSVPFPDALRQRYIPLMAVAGDGTMENRLLAVRDGASAYFLAPLNFGRFIRKLEELTAPPEEHEPFRVLVVDDEEHLARHYALILKQAGMTVRAIHDPLLVMESLHDIEPELVLMDLYMPGCTGYELAQVLRQRDSLAGVPIVFLSSESRPEKQQKAMGLGGDDFLTKPVDGAHLVSAVSSRIACARVMRGFMVRDSLTGLYNHTRIKEQLATEVFRSQRQKTSLSFAMVDLDHFKSVNDTYGHQMGDHVILSLSQMLEQRLRRSDTCGRYGGEEFAIILPDTDGKAAKGVLEGIREDFAGIVLSAKDATFSVTFSCGIATFCEDDSANDLVKRADKALYEAKEAGRNRVLLSQT